MRFGDYDQFRHRSFSLAFFFFFSTPPFFFFLQTHFSSRADFVCDCRTIQDLGGPCGRQEYGACVSQLGAFDEAALRNLI